MIWGLGLGVCLQSFIYSPKNKKKIINGLYAIYRPLIMHGLIRA